MYIYIYIYMYRCVIRIWMPARHLQCQAAHADLFLTVKFRQIEPWV